MAFIQESVEEANLTAQQKPKKSSLTLFKE